MTWQDSATWATYIAIITAIPSLFFVTRVSHDSLQRHALILLAVTIFTYLLLFFFDTSYFFFGLSLENWAVWRRNFARWAYALLHACWLFSLYRAYRHARHAETMAHTLEKEQRDL